MALLRCELRHQLLGCLLIVSVSLSQSINFIYEPSTSSEEAVKQSESFSSELNYSQLVYLELTLDFFWAFSMRTSFKHIANKAEAKSTREILEQYGSDENEEKELMYLILFHQLQPSNQDLVLYDIHMISECPT